MQSSTTSVIRELVLKFVFFLLIIQATTVSAQTSLAVMWDSETGCQVYGNDGPRKFLEDIGNSPCVRVCEDKTVTYTLIGDTTTISSATWNITGGTLATSNNTSAIVDWGIPGFGNVQIIITFTDGTISTYNMCVERVTAPKAQFTVTNAYGDADFTSCIGEAIFFDNTSISTEDSPIVSSYWDFGDPTSGSGNYSQAENPNHTYTAEGVYTVILTVINECNCQSEFKYEVLVGKQGIEIFCPSVVCEGELATYTSPLSNVRCNGEEWVIAGGTIVGTVPYGIKVHWDTPDQTGFGYVSFNTEKCDVPCPSITTIKVPIVLNEGTISGPSNVCGKEQYVYSLPQWPTTEYNWEIVANPFGGDLILNDQRNEVILDAPGSGQIILSCTYYNTLLHCGGHATITINILPQTSVEGPLVLCENQTGNYILETETGAVLDGYWTLEGPNGFEDNFGTSFSPTFTTAGMYVLTAVGTGSCPHPPVYINVFEAPVAPAQILGPLEICPNVTNIYSVSNTVSNTEIFWEVTGGNISGPDFADNVSIIFNPTGPYQVRAKRVNKSSPYCASVTTSLDVEILSPELEIHSNVPFNPVCSSSYASYTVEVPNTVGGGTAPFAGAETYEWSITPVTAGSVMQGQNTNSITVLWNQVTLDLPVLTVIVKKCNLTFTTNQTVTVVNAPPLTINGPSTICAGESFQFTLPGYTSGGVQWDFGNGQGSTNPNPTYTYPQSDSTTAVFTVTVTVTDANGCIGTVTDDFSISVIPVPNATMTIPGTIELCNVIDLPQLTVNIVGGFGSTSTINWFEMGSNTPIFTEDTSIPPGIVGQFDPQTFGEYYAVVTYGDTGCSDTTNAVALVEDCPEPECIVNGNPDIVLSATITDCLKVEVSAAFTGTPSSPQSYEWRYPTSFTINTATDSESFASFTATTPGQYIITYEGYYPGQDNELCSIIKTITVIIPYKADMLSSIRCGAVADTYDITLYDHSTHAAGLSITHLFYAGTNTSSSPLNTIETTELDINGLTPGQTYNYTLAITDGIHPPCLKTISVVIPPIPSADFTFTNSPACIGEPIYFQAVDTSTGLTYQWDFNDDSFNNLPDPERSYTVTGPRDVTLTVTNQYGCEKSVTKPVFVYDFSSMAGFITPALSLECEGESVILVYTSLTSTTPSQYQWMNGNLLIAGANSDSYTATDNGSYWLSATDENGCTERLNQTIAITNFIPTPNINVTGPHTVCADEQFTLNAYSGSTSITYTWSIDNVPQPQWENMIEITHVLSIPDTYIFTLETTLNNGTGACPSITTHAITVLPLPSAPEIEYSIDCDTYKVSLWVTDPQPGTYTWSNGTSGSSTTSYFGGPIQVRYTNSSGCSVTAQEDVPKNPDDYMWIFPSGCFTFCKGFEAGDYELIGPAVGATIENWKWMKGGSTAAAGVFEVDPFTVSSTGEFNLFLDNGWCEKISDPMVLSDYDCEDCDLKIELKGDIKLEKDEQGICHYSFALQFENPNSYPLTVTISSNVGAGILIPSTSTIPPTAPGTYFVIDFLFYVVSPFSGGLVEFTFTGEQVDNDKLCQETFEMQLPNLGECTTIISKPYTIGLPGGDKRFHLLQIIPNPATQATEFRYLFANDNTDAKREISVYDIVGRPIAMFPLKENNGTVAMQLGGYPAGYYIVLLKENDQIIQQQKLIVK
jgi:PKD repeat protein